jgi:hypothetical protein
MPHDIVDVYWITTMSATCIGIVTIRDTVTKELKYYIGLGDGYDGKADAEKIADFGTPFFPKMIYTDKKK